jgi:hypothetical protein
MVTPWVFEARRKRDKKRDPMEANFFTGEEDDEEVYGRTDSLVREALQNSLDARPRKDGKLSTEPVRVRFTVGRSPIPEARARFYLDGLIPHLEAAELKNETVSQANVPPMHFLAYEDFGTRGLCGEPERRDDPVAGTELSAPQDFYWFWWNVGRSGKRGADRGRWGVGKTVFPACSKINAMFALTCQHGSGRRLLMGQSVMKIHHIGDVEYEPDGCFCDPAKSAEVQLPFEDEAVLKAFEADFGLSRKDMPGTSIVVPYSFERLSPKPLLESIIVHYFVPIVRGELVAEVQGPSMPLTIVNKDTIHTVAATLQWAGKRAEKKHNAPPTLLAKWANERRASNDIPSLSLHGKAPAWSADLFTPALLASLQAQYSARQRIAVRVPVSIDLTERYAKELKPNSTATSIATSFDVFIERDETAERGEDYFVRGGMTISGISTIASARGIRAVVLVDEAELATFLGDAEGPAHTDWKEGEETLRRRYEKYTSRIRFVRNAVAKLLALLVPAPKGLNRDLLRDLFYVETEELVADEDTDPTPPIPPIEPTNPLPYDGKPTSGGFRVFGRKVEGRSRPVALKVDAAFEVDGMSTARSLKRYSEFDFRFDNPESSSLKIECDGCEVSADRNSLELRPEKDEFEVVVSGFPANTDVVFRIKDLSQPEVAEETEASVEGVQ